MGETWYYALEYPDSFSAAKKATEYLINLGHKRISYCDIYSYNQQPNAHYSATDRRAGYVMAMKEASLELMDITPDPEEKVEETMDKQMELFYSILKHTARQDVSWENSWRTMKLISLTGPFSRM